MPPDDEDPMLSRLLEQKQQEALSRAPEVQSVGEVSPPTERGAPGGGDDPMLLRLQQDAARAPQRENIREAATTNPDQYAQDRKLGQDTGLPTDTVERNRDEVVAQQQAQQTDDLLRDAPVTDAFMAVPENAKLAHDSVPDLVSLETLFNSWRAINAGSVKYTGSILSGAGELYDIANRGMQHVEDTIFDATGVNSLLDKAFGTEGVTHEQMREALKKGKDENWFLDPSQILSRPGEAIKNMGEALGPDAKDKNVFTDISEGAGQLAAQLTVGLLTGNAASLVSTLSLTASGADQMHDDAKAKGASQSDSDTVTVLGAGITAMTERYGLNLLLDRIPAAAKNKITQMLMSAGSEMSQEILEGTLQNLAAMSLYDPERKILDLDTLYQGGVAGATGALAGLFIPGHQTGVSPMARGREALARVDQMDEAHKTIMASPLNERAPDVMAAHVDGVMKENGIDSVFVNVDALDQHAVDQGVIPAALYEKWGIDPDEAERARALGGDIQISGRQYAEHVLATDSYDALKDHLRIGDERARLDGEPMTKVEAEELSKVKADVAAIGTGQDETEGVSTTRVVNPDQTIRYYHGTTSENANGFEGDTFVSPHEDYARNYHGNANNVLYTDFTKEEAIKRGLYDEVNNIPIHGSIKDGAERLKAPAEAEVKAAQEAKADEQVTLAEDSLGLQGLFRTAKEAGMTDDKYKVYLAAVDRSKDAGRRNQAEKLQKDRLRVNGEQWQEERAKERASILESTQNEPIYQAFNNIGQTRLSRESILAALPAEHGETLLEQLPKQKGGRPIVTSKGEKGGMDINAYAELHDMSPDVLLYALADMIPLNEAVDARTDKAMVLKHGSLIDERNALNAAIESLHTDRTAEVLALELDQLKEDQGAPVSTTDPATGKTTTKNTKPNRTKPALMLAAAKEGLQKYKLSDILVDKFLNTQARQAKQAGKLLRAGDRPGAVKAKFRQLLNFQYAREASHERENITKEVRGLRRLTLRKPPGLPSDHYEQITSILGSLDLGRKLSDKKRSELMAEAQAKADADGTEIVIPKRIANSDGKTNWQDLTLYEWREITDGVAAIKKAGLEENKMAREEEIATRQERADEVAGQIATHLKKTTSSVETTNWEKVKHFGRDIATTVLNADTILREIDGWTNLGAAYRNIKGRYDKAMNGGYRHDQVGYMPRQKIESDRLKEIINILSEDERNDLAKRRLVPGTGHIISRSARLSVMLNMGNDGNRSALIDSKQFTKGDLEAIKNSASKTEWQFVEGVWKYLDSFWPEVAAAQKRRTDSVPERVVATEVETPHGTFSGGYYPLAFDSNQAVLEGVNSAEDAIKRMRQGSFSSSHTARGHTEERTASGGRPVLLSLNTISSHINNVIYDLEVGDAVTDIYRVLHHKTVKDAFNERGQKVKWDGLDLWLRDVITGEVRANDGWSKTFRRARTGFTIAKLAWNFKVAALQPLGLLQSMATVGKAPIAKATMKVLFSNPFGEDNLYKFVDEQTPAMAERSSSWQKDVTDTSRSLSKSIVNDLAHGTDGWIAESFFWPIKKTQKFVDTVTWIAAKERGLKEFSGDTQKANDYADRMVIRAQGSGIFGERSAIERGSISRNSTQNEMTRSWTGLISYFIAKNNIAYEKTKQMSFRNPGQMVSMASDIFLLYAAEGITTVGVGNLIDALFYGDDDDDDKGFLASIGAETLKTMTAGIPLVRDVSAYVQGFDAGGVMGSVLSDAGTIITEGVKAGKRYYEDEDVINKELVKSVNNVLGTWLRYPASQLSKTGSTVNNIIDGNDWKAIELITGPKYRP